MNKPLYDLSVRLSGEIVEGTNIITSKDDISEFPSTGFFRIEREIISYTSKDDGSKTFSGCARGEFSTIPALHADNESMALAETIVDNPINILLKLLTSGSGSGSYDALVDGLAIDPALIDVAGLEALRDSDFSGLEFSLALYADAIQGFALPFIEKQILDPCNLRFSFTDDSKLTVVRLNSASFVDHVDVMDHDSLTGASMEIDATQIVNRIEIEWDYDEGTGSFRNKSVYTDDDSIATYGKCTSPLSYSFRGAQDESFVDSFANDLLDRLSTPKPVVSVGAFISKSLLNVGQVGRVETRRLPNEFGELNFGSDMEILERAINHKTGQVTMKLIYTSWSSTRLGYIGPSDTFLSVVGQDEVNLAAGRGDLYQAGWKVRLWNNLTGDYEADPVNEIASISGDDLTFATPWATTITTHHRIKFADYDSVVESQKRYAFVSPTGSDFSALEKSYKIVP